VIKVKDWAGQAMSSKLGLCPNYEDNGLMRPGMGGRQAAMNAATRRYYHGTPRQRVFSPPFATVTAAVDVVTENDRHAERHLR
jgi:hypothetical protein